MNTKQEIINKINTIENPAILEEILNLIRTESEFEEIYAFTNKEKTAVNEGLKDLDEGRSYSTEDSKKNDFKMAKRTITWSLRAINDKLQIYTYWI